MIYSFEPNTDQEVSVSKGDEVVVLSGGDREWLYVRTRHGCEGYVPACLTGSIDKQGKLSFSSFPFFFFFFGKRKQATRRKERN